MTNIQLQENMNLSLQLRFNYQSVEKRVYNKDSITRELKIEPTTKIQLPKI